MTVLVSCFRCGKPVLARKETLTSTKPPYCSGCRNSLGIDDSPEEETPKAPPPKAPPPRPPRPTSRVTATPSRTVAQQDAEDRPSPREESESYSGLLIFGVFIFLGTLLLGVFAIVGFLLLAPKPTPLAANSSSSSTRPVAGVTPRPQDPEPPANREPPQIRPAGMPPPALVPIGPVVVEVSLRQTIHVATTGVWGVAFSPRGDILVTASGHLGSRGQMRFWLAATGRPTGPTLASGSDYFGVAFRPDTDQIGLAAGSNGLQLWSRQGGIAQATFRYPSYVRSVAFSPDGRRVAGNCEQKLSVWDLGSGAELWSTNLEGGLIPWRIATHVAFSPDGKLLASGHGGRDLIVHDATSGEVRATGRGHDDLVLCTAFSPDGRYLVSGSFDKTIKVWDPLKGQEVQTLRGHRDWVYCVAFSRDGRTLASAGREGAVILWDVPSGRQLANLPARPSEATCVAFSPDGKTLASSGVDGNLQIWDVSGLGGKP